MIIKADLKKIKIVPDVELIAREMTTTSQVGIIINRVKVLHLGSLSKVVVNNIPYILKVAKKDFAIGIKVLTELEILKLMEAGNAKSIALHQQMTDMAVALNNRKIIQYYLGMAQSYSFTPYLVTANVGPLIKLISRLRNAPTNLSIIADLSNVNDGLKEYVRKSNLQFIKNIGDKK